jgi:hypothetical protein
MFKCSCDDIFRLIRKVYKILRILPNIMDSSFPPLLYDLCFVSLWLFQCFFKVVAFIFFFWWMLPVFDLSIRGLAYSMPLSPLVQ